MFGRSSRLSLASAALLIAVVSPASLAWGLGFELGQTKEELKLDYVVEVQDHGTGRITVQLTLADAGRLAPLTAVDMNIPGADGTGYVDLSLSLQPREADGKKVYTIHGLRESVERASIQLKTRTLDGKEEPLTWYYHAVPVAEHLAPTAEADAKNDATKE